MRNHCGKARAQSSRRIRRRWNDSGRDKNAALQSSSGHLRLYRGRHARRGGACLQRTAERATERYRRNGARRCYMAALPRLVRADRRL